MAAEHEAEAFAGRNPEEQGGAPTVPDCQSGDGAGGYGHGRVSSRGPSARLCRSGVAPSAAPRSARQGDALFTRPAFRQGKTSRIVAPIPASMAAVWDWVAPSFVDAVGLHIVLSFELDG